MNRKDIFMTGFKSKLGFSFTHKDMEEFETIIDFYEKENARLKEKIEKLNDYIENRISVLTVSVDNKVKDEYFNNKCIGGVQELKNVKVILKEN